MKESITGAELKAMVISAAANIELHKQAINDLNVFPVPDGDTGTNMALTLANAARELQKAPDSLTVGKCAEITAGALLRGARGNSGVITSLLFRGFSKRMRDHTDADGAAFAAALTEGVEAAYNAVMKPAEGTILTVSRVSAEHATAAALDSTALEFVLDTAIEWAKNALGETIELNPVLKKAGVVDAGGQGFLLILEAMRSAMLGNPIVSGPAAAPQPAAQSVFSAFSDEDITFGYCTEFIVSRKENRSPELLRAFLNTIGDSLVLVEDDEIIKVHVHTDNPGTAIQEALKYGPLLTVKVENMRLQHTEKVLDTAEAPAGGPKPREIAPPEKQYGVVTVCAGDGIAAMFRDLGVDEIVSGGQTMNPSTEDILAAVDATPAEVVFILPNNKNIVMAAQQCAPLSDKRIVVLPTATVPQGITAMLNLDVSATVEANTEAMTKSLSAVTTMQITYAARNSDFDGHSISAGDYLALCGGALFGTDRDIHTLLTRLAEKARELGSTFITIFYGDDTHEDDAKQAQQIFETICPDAEVNLLSGGQPVYYYLISAE